MAAPLDLSSDLPSDFKRGPGSPAHPDGPYSPYPAHLIEAWHLPDGTAVVVRPIHAGDLQIETDFVNGLSPASSYWRLLSPRKLMPEELRRFTDIDYSRELALIGTVQVDGREQQIGVARYVIDAARDVAEFAIVIADRAQGSGLGEKLMRNLVAAAREAGVSQMSDITLATNIAMKGLAHKLGFRLHQDPNDATVTRMTLDLR